MTYATKQDLVDRFGAEEIAQLTDHSRAGDIDDDVLARALSDADGEIDAHIEGRYQLPLTTVPRALNRIACDIARYYLYPSPPDQVKKRYDDAIRFLVRVGKAEIKLGSSEESQPESDNAVQLESGGNVFDRSDTSFI